MQRLNTCLRRVIRHVHFYFCQTYIICKCNDSIVWHCRQTSRILALSEQRQCNFDKNESRHITSLREVQASAESMDTNGCLWGRKTTLRKIYGICYKVQKRLYDPLSMSYNTNWQQSNRNTEKILGLGLDHRPASGCVKWPLAQRVMSVVSVTTLHQIIAHDMLVRECAGRLFIYITFTMFANTDISLCRPVASPGPWDSTINNVTVMQWKSVPRIITWRLWCLTANHLSNPATTPPP